MNDHTPVHIVKKRSKENLTWKTISFYIAIQRHSNARSATPLLHHQQLFGRTNFFTQTKNLTNVENVSRHSGSVIIWKVTYRGSTPVKIRRSASFATNISQTWKCIRGVIAVRRIFRVKCAKGNSNIILLLWATLRENMEPIISNAKNAPKSIGVCMIWKDIQNKSIWKVTLNKHYSTIRFCITTSKHCKSKKPSNNHCTVPIHLSWRYKK